MKEAERTVNLPARKPDGSAPILSFEKFYAKQDVPCWIVFDIETYCTAAPEDGDILASNARVASFAYAAFGLDGVFEVPARHRYRVFYDRGDDDNEVDCVTQGIKSLMELVKSVKDAQKHPDPKLTASEEEQFNKASRCYLCRCQSDELVRDHCHFTGKYRGPCCKRCNANLKFRDIPCLAHDLGGFDGGAVQRAISRLKNPDNEEGEQYLKLRYKCINKSGEKLISIDFGQLKFPTR